MTTKSFRALLVATAAAVLLTATGAQAAGSAPKLTPAVQKQLLAAQKAAGTNDWAAAKAAIEEAKSATKSDYDNYMVSNFTVFVDAKSGDMAGAATAAQAVAASSAQPEEDKVKNLRTAISLSLQVKQFDQAVPLAKALAATNPTDFENRSMIVQAYYFAKDLPDAEAGAQALVDSQIKAGQAPDRNTLDLLLSAQAQQKKEEAAERTLETKVAYYNDPNDWQEIIDVTFSTKGLRDIDGIWLGRLLFLSGATVSAQDATMIGSTASHLTFYGDAQVAQKNGGTGFPDASALAAKDKATIPAQIAAGQKQNGQYNIKLAEALYSYGMYPEAEAAARLAISKGGATDASEPPMVLGQALAAQGKYDDALAAFGQVTGGGPATPRTTRLWIAYTNAKKTPASATAAK